VLGIDLALRHGALLEECGSKPTSNSVGVSPSNEFYIQISFDFSRVSDADRQSNSVGEDGKRKLLFENVGEFWLFSGAVSNAGEGELR
jgi:hypothetical protein